MDITDRQITKIARVASSLSAKMIKADGVGTAEFDLVHIVRKHPGISQKEICRLLGSDKGAIAKETANLVSKGFLRKENNPADGRSQLIFPTEKAELLKRSKAHIEAVFYEWLMEDLSEEDKAEFARVLGLIYRKSKAESLAGFPSVRARLEECDE